MTDIRDEILAFVYQTPGCTNEKIFYQWDADYCINERIKAIIYLTVQGLIRRDNETNVLEVTESGLSMFRNRHTLRVSQHGNSMTPRIKKIPIEEYDREIHGYVVLLFRAGNYPEYQKYRVDFGYYNSKNKKWWHRDLVCTEIVGATHFIPLSAIWEVIE